MKCHPHNRLMLKFIVFFLTKPHIIMGEKNENDDNTTMTEQGVSI